MWILPLLGYVGVVLGFAFLTLAIGKYLLHIFVANPAGEA